MYCTLTDLLERGFLDDVLNTQDGASDVSDLDMTIINKAISDATVTIDGYLSGRYSLPLATPFPVLVRIACDLTIYFLQKNRPKERVREKYDAWIVYLKDVSRGVVILGSTSSVIPATESMEHEAFIQSAPSIFRR